MSPATSTSTSNSTIEPRRLELSTVLPIPPDPNALPSGANHDELANNKYTGTLCTAPLSTVLIAATDALYQDVVDMCQGEIEVTRSTAAAAAVGSGGGGGGGGGEGGDTIAESGSNLETLAAGAPVSALQAPAAPASSLVGPGGLLLAGNGGGGATATASNIPQDKMASLSFAQRRHELASRLARHSKSMLHCAALVSAYGYNDPDFGANNQTNASKTKAATATRGGRKTPTAASISNPKATNTSSTTAVSKFPRRGELSHLVSTTSRTFHHVHMAQSQADETQDALYFVHDGLWKARGHVHDVRGGLEVICGYAQAQEEDGGEEDGGEDNGQGGVACRTMVRKGRWSDFPRDAALTVDRYHTSAEGTWTEAETRERLRTNVRRKLLTGEVGVVRSMSMSMGANGAAADGKDEDDDGDDAGASASRKLPWRMILERGGGTVRLVHGAPRRFGIAATVVGGGDGDGDGDGEDTAPAPAADANAVYPMEARLTVLAESDATHTKEENSTSTSLPTPAPWTLLSVQVAVSAKTGEDNHQLHLTKKQMFDLHRLCVRSMTVEEAQTNKLNELESEKKDEGEDSIASNDKMEIDVVQKSLRRKASAEPLRHPSTGVAISRPLSCLFDVAHNFASSLHLQMISAQAQALMKGAWSGDSALAVTPVHFFDVSAVGDNEEEGSGRSPASAAALGCVAIHFWSVDDRYGRPALGDLTLASNQSHKPTDSSSVSSKSRSGNDVQKHLFRPDGKAAGRLTLCMHAVAGVGVVASLSAGDDVIDAIEDTADSKGQEEVTHQNRLERIISRIVTATSSPFDLSASDALLAATTLCAERRCEAAVEAIEKTDGAAAESPRLPSWIKLVVECGTISVGTKISYYGADASSSNGDEKYVELFRLECDSKTGKFIPTFSRDAVLLRMLSCNDSRASELQALSTAAMVGRRTQMKYATGDDLTGRTIREAFDGLSRAMSLLGERVGVGGTWVDSESTASSLRARAVEVACRDVRKSLATCAGMAAVFGLSALAAKVSSGVEALVDMAGGPIKANPENKVDSNGNGLLNIPPVAIALNQQVIQKKEMLNSGEEKTTTLLEKDVLAIAASVDQDALTLHAFDVTVQSTKPSLPPERMVCNRIPFSSVPKLETLSATSSKNNRSTKRRKIEKTNNDGDGRRLRSLAVEVQRLAPMLVSLIN